MSRRSTFVVGLLAASSLAVGAVFADSDEEKSKVDTTDGASQEVAKDFDFTFTPDGETVAYYSYRGDKLPDIFARRHHGAEVNLTSRADTWDIEPDFSPDGRQIVYSSGESMANLSLRIMAADGSHDREFYDGPDNEVGATWSPDGDYVVFAAFNRNDDTNNIFVMDKTGSNLRALTKDLPGQASGPSWSPDGKWIAFSHKAGEEAAQNIFVMRPDGSHRRQLTDNRFFKMGPVFSPNGKEIYFSSSSEDGMTDIYVVPFDVEAPVKEPRQITETEKAHEYFLRFTPKGDHLVFSRGDWQDGFALAHMAFPGHQNAHH